jgi:hypothetical protein
MFSLLFLADARSIFVGNVDWSTEADELAGRDWLRDT